MIAIKQLAMLALGGTLLLMGCVKNRPRMPAAINPANHVGEYKLTDFQTDLATYRGFMSATPPNLPAARRQRDMMINRIMVDTEGDYKEYEITVFADRAKFDTAGDILELGITAATTVSNGARVKTVLAAALSGVTGSRLSYDKNFYREKTTEIIISKMQASRTVIKNQIVDKMTSLDADRYPFEEAWIDLIDFFYAGTVEGGLEALAVDAGSSAKAAADKTDASIRFRIRNFSPAQLTDITLCRNRFNELFNSHDVATARSILNTLKVPIAAGASESQVFVKLNEQLRKAADDPSFTEQLMTAFGLK